MKSLHFFQLRNLQLKFKTGSTCCNLLIINICFLLSPVSVELHGAVRRNRVQSVFSGRGLLLQTRISAQVWHFAINKIICRSFRAFYYEQNSCFADCVYNLCNTAATTHHRWCKTNPSLVGLNPAHVFLVLCEQYRAWQIRLHNKSALQHSSTTNLLIQLINPTIFLGFMKMQLSCGQNTVVQFVLFLHLLSMTETCSTQYFANVFSPLHLWFGNNVYIAFIMLLKTQHVHQNV